MPQEKTPRPDGLPDKDEWIARSGDSPDDIGDGRRKDRRTAVEHERNRENREDE